MWRDSESEHDFLNFTEVADQIAALATNSALLPISIGVFGSWGTGKSTVLQLVEGRLPKSGDNVPIVVRFDAWMYQGFDDARAALMEVVSRKILTLAETNESFVDNAKAFAGRVNYFRGLGLIADFGLGMALGIPPGLLTRAGGALSSMLSGGGTADNYDELKKDVAEAKKDWSELVKPAEKRTPPQEIDAFRREFGELLDGLNTTLVLFIDNLDRCLPDVAIGTLEAIRLFLFMPRTAFVIAADEDMIRHSVAKHFNDPNAAHVRDYLDKVIQVPLRVPQVGAEDLRAYMYSLFVGLGAPEKLPAVQSHLMTALQHGWKGDTFEKAEVAKLAGEPPELLDNLAIADVLAPILAWAPNVQGNATLAAARRFADVVSTDYVGALLDRGHERAEADRLPVIADAEALPFPDASFDVVLSTFGVMFTPNQAQAANELFRVCRPGGKIGMANWTPVSFIGHVFKTIAKYVPPAPGMKSPALWGPATRGRATSCGDEIGNGASWWRGPPAGGRP